MVIEIDANSQPVRRREVDCSLGDSGTFCACDLRRMVDCLRALTVAVSKN